MSVTLAVTLYKRQFGDVIARDRQFLHVYKPQYVRVSYMNLYRILSESVNQEYQGVLFVSVIDESRSVRNPSSICICRADDKPDVTSTEIDIQ